MRNVLAPAVLGAQASVPQQRDELDDMLAEYRAAEVQQRREQERLDQLRLSCLLQATVDWAQ